jgi:hypothetical protein
MCYWVIQPLTPRRYAFCELVSEEAATAVVTNMNNFRLDMYRTLVIQRLADCDVLPSNDETRPEGTSVAA